MNKLLRSLISFVLVTLLTLASPALVSSQTSAPSPNDGSNGAAVTLDNETLYIIHEKFGASSPEQRAANTSRQLANFAKQTSTPVDALTVTDMGDKVSLIHVADQAIASVLEADAEASGKSREDLAQEHLQSIKQAVNAYRQRHSVKSLLWAIGYAVVATIAFALVLLLLNKVTPWFTTRLDSWRSTYIPNLQIQNLEVLSSNQITTFLIGLVKLTWLILVLSLLFIYVSFTLSLFPVTQQFGNTLFGYLSGAIQTIAQAIISYLPNLLTIIFILIITYYLLRFLKMVSLGLSRGRLSIPGFYAEWAEPTYKLLTYLIVVMVAAIIFPYLPGSGSPAFQGISIFLGILVSLGSTAAIANIVSGFILIYTRAFQIGDRVKISDTVGHVENKLLLVTRIRTPDNVLVTVPNAALLTSNIINYSALIRESDTPLILPTTITLGYEVPWRQVHEVLIAAARATQHILDDPPPFVLQTALSDFYVSYELKAYTNHPSNMQLIYSELHQNIQDYCNTAGIEICSPHYAAVRDGNQSTIPENYLSKDYTAPGFRFDPLASLFGKSSDTPNESISSDYHPKSGE